MINLSPLRLVISLGLLALLFETSAQAAGPTVVCQSIHKKPASCPVSAGSKVTLLKQISRDACVEGVSWGFENGSIWVKNGCRAKFSVTQSN